MIKKDYCVIGLGRFGISVAETLIKLGHSVMAIDINTEKVNAIAADVSYAVALDSTDQQSLKEVGINEMDHIIVGIGSDIQSSIMTCALLLEIGLTKITAKAINSRHEKVLKNLGISDIVRPEQFSGKRTATKIVHSFFGQFSSLSDEHSIIELNINNKELINKPLGKLKLRNRGIQIVLIKRQNYFSLPTHETKIKKNDSVFIICKNTNISKIKSILSLNNKKY